ncbi:hypothetical protein BKA61DRAFT_111994 [Leptodontidium sp. MPI-SDFR-AT-0119]|nr:hypothetical protein BKA61DRAFT_111994 [Leptodontidium sp. MPI-SDFR-AT-0119]
MVTHESKMFPEYNLPSPLLLLPAEIRHQILTLALATQGPANSVYFRRFKPPKDWHHWISFDRPVLQLLKSDQTTCIMSVNKQIYAEAFAIVFSEFAFGFDTLPTTHSYSIAWLQKPNPRALEKIAHFHILDFQCLVNEDRYPEVVFGENQSKVTAGYRALAEKFPLLKSVRLQLRFTKMLKHTTNARDDARCVERIMGRVKAFGDVHVLVFQEPPPQHASEERKQCLEQIVSECQRRLGQKQLQSSW